MSKKRRYGELGQGLVEFAVIFPLFVFFLFAVLDVGLALNRRATLQHAAREGARYAATSADLGDNVAMGRTIGQAQNIIDPEDVCFSYRDPVTDAPISAANADPGDAVDVEIEYFYHPFILNIGLSFFGVNTPDFDLTVKGSSRLERALDPGADALCP